MKIKSAICMVFLVALFVFMSFMGIAPQSFAANAAEKTDFVGMYKQYFKDMMDKKYKEVWAVSTVSSKETIAKEIAKSSKTEITYQEVMKILENDTNNVRTVFLDSFTSEAPVKRIYEEGAYTAKSSNKDEVILTITLDNDPKDFKMLKEDGVWKINFFYDIMN